MTCDRMKDLVHAYLDDELSLTEQLSFEQHLATCPDCEQAHRVFSQLRQQLRTSELSFELPAAMQAKLRRSLPVTKPPIRRILARAAIVVIVLGATAVLLSRVNRSTLEQNLVDAHIRSLQADHLLDVASTDQHTVKPWFDGKLNFAPPVRDLAADGFPLIGGRLDYLSNRPVAALVYQHRKHQINLFIWPESGGDETLKTSTINGYQVLEWRQAEMRQVAVSDLNALEMREFVEKLKR